MREMERNGTTKRLSSVLEVDCYSIIVHSHLKWDWVWQRPQQFLSRLSRKHRVLFVENPDASDASHATRVDLREVSDFPNINVLQIRIPANRASDTPWVGKARAERELFLLWLRSRCKTFRGRKQSRAATAD